MTERRSHYNPNAQQEGLSTAWALLMLQEHLPADAFFVTVQFLGFRVEPVMNLLESLGTDVEAWIEDGYPVLWSDGQRHIFQM